jgi:hypothetical protein
MEITAQNLNIIIKKLFDNYSFLTHMEGNGVCLMDIPDNEVCVGIPGKIKIK